RIERRALGEMNQNASQPAVIEFATVEYEAFVGPLERKYLIDHGPFGSERKARWVAVTFDATVRIRRKVGSKIQIANKAVDAIAASFRASREASDRRRRPTGQRLDLGKQVCIARTAVVHKLVFGSPENAIVFRNVLPFIPVGKLASRDPARKDVPRKM